MLNVVMDSCVAFVLPDSNSIGTYVGIAGAVLFVVSRSFVVLK